MQVFKAEQHLRNFFRYFKMELDAAEKNLAPLYYGVKSLCCFSVSGTGKISLIPNIPTYYTLSAS
jgi:hypothetical protein